MIKITDGRLWKRHADQIRGMLDSPDNTSTPTIVEQPPVSDSRTPTTPPKSATSDDRTTVPPTSPSVSTPTDQSSQEDSAQPRYPVRVRGPPKRLTYDSSFCSEGESVVTDKIKLHALLSLSHVSCVLYHVALDSCSPCVAPQVLPLPVTLLYIRLSVLSVCRFPYSLISILIIYF